MNARVWIELGEKQSAFAIENAPEGTLEYIDLTGGYKTMQIPFKIAYLENEDTVVCGEEADNFEHTVWAKKSPETTLDFVRSCLSKIIQQYHHYTVTDLILINGAGFSAKHCHRVQKTLAKQSGLAVEWVSIKEAFVGYGYHHGYQEASFVYFNSSKSMHFHFSGEAVEKEQVARMVERPIALEAIDRFYLDKLQAAHQKIYDKVIERQRIEKTYNDQKMLLYRQCQSKQDVHVYTSICYPPKKITLDYIGFNTFFEQWIKKNQEHMEQAKDKCLVGGGYTKACFWKRLMGQGNYYYDEHMLMIGAQAFINYRQIHGKDLCTQTKTHWGYGIIDQEQRRIMFIKPGQIYEKKYVIDLVLTDYQRSVPFVKYDEAMQETHLFNLYIHPENATTQVTMTMEISVEGQIEEVNYDY